MYPVCLRLENKLCVVIGGGAVAERKVDDILLHGGRVLLISPQVSDKLRSLAEQRVITWLEKGYSKGDINGAFLVYAATSDSRIQHLVRQEAEQLNLLINVADDPDGSSFHVPATVHRDNLTIAISTNGKSPAMSAMVRRTIEESIGDEYGMLLEIMTMVRTIVLEHVDEREEKREVFQKILDSDMCDWLKKGQWQLVADHVENVLGSALNKQVTLDWEYIREKYA